jgi:general secretion pathway protein I
MKRHGRPSIRLLRRRLGTGFTLIEVLIAVTILAIAMGAVISGMARFADNAASLREKTVALWVAHNRLTEIDLEPGWPAIGKSDGEVEMAGVEWHWFVTVSETPDPDVRRIEIRVQPRGRETDSAALSSFIGKTGRAS